MGVDKTARPIAHRKMVLERANVEKQNVTWFGRAIAETKAICLGNG